MTVSIVSTSLPLIDLITLQLISKRLEAIGVKARASYLKPFHCVAFQAALIPARFKEVCVGSVGRCGFILPSDTGLRDSMDPFPPRS